MGNIAADSHICEFFHVIRQLSIGFQYFAKNLSLQTVICKQKGQTFHLNENN